jgi:hypothetical protein
MALIRKPAAWCIKQTAAKFDPAAAKRGFGAVRAGRQQSVDYVNWPDIVREQPTLSAKWNSRVVK